MGTTKYKSSAKGVIYHIYNRGNQKKEIFLDSHDFSFYIHKLQKAVKDYNFSLIAYCLMPNHVHLVVKQNTEQTPQLLIASLHTSYSKFFNKKYKLIGHLFQGRYKQKIVTSDEYARYLVAYIHLNPVQAGLCNVPQEYPWSSYREYQNKTKVNTLCEHPLIHELGLSLDITSPLILMSIPQKISPKEMFDD